MRHRKTGRKLGRTSAPRRALFRNLTTDLLRYGHLVTTEAKGKEVRGFAEGIIGLGKEGTLSSRRRALGFLTDTKVVKKVFSELSDQYTDRPGGYIRIVKLGPRQGDGAPLVRLELV